MLCHCSRLQRFAVPRNDTHWYVSLYCDLLGYMVMQEVWSFFSLVVHIITKDVIPSVSEESLALPFGGLIRFLAALGMTSNSVRLN